MTQGLTYESESAPYAGDPDVRLWPKADISSKRCAPTGIGQ